VYFSRQTPFETRQQALLNILRQLVPYHQSQDYLFSILMQIMKIWKTHLEFLIYQKEIHIIIKTSIN
jgi:hypothetical protein